MDEEVEFLFGGAELDVGFEHHGVVGRQQGIEQLVNGNRLIVVQTRTEVLTLQHPG